MEGGKIRTKEKDTNARWCRGDVPKSQDNGTFNKSNIINCILKKNTPTARRIRLERAKKGGNGDEDKVEDDGSNPVTQKWNKDDQDSGSRNRENGQSANALLSSTDTI